MDLPIRTRRVFFALPRRRSANVPDPQALLAHAAKSGHPAKSCRLLEAPARKGRAAWRRCGLLTYGSKAEADAAVLALGATTFEGEALQCREDEGGTHIFPGGNQIPIATFPFEDEAKEVATVDEAILLMNGYDWGADFTLADMAAVDPETPGCVRFRCRESCYSFADIAREVEGAVGGALMSAIIKYDQLAGIKDHFGGPKDVARAARLIAQNAGDDTYDVGFTAVKGKAFARIGAGDLAFLRALTDFFALKLAASGDSALAKSVDGGELVTSEGGALSRTPFPRLSTWHDAAGLESLLGTALMHLNPGLTPNLVADGVKAGGAVYNTSQPWASFVST